MKSLSGLIERPWVWMAMGGLPPEQRSQARFEFTSPTAGAAYECALDGAGFSPCNSPRIVRVGKGRHNFQVRAVAAGLTDATPASHDWKVKKKKRKKRG